jgi:hypothetical protein
MHLANAVKKRPASSLRLANFLLNKRTKNRTNASFDDAHPAGIQNAIRLCALRELSAWSWRFVSPAFLNEIFCTRNSRAIQRLRDAVALRSNRSQECWSAGQLFTRGNNFCPLRLILETSTALCWQTKCFSLDGP